MSKKLLIVESPTKARTITTYLKGEYDVIASVGHVRDLPKSNKNAIDIEHGFVPHYVVSPGKREIINRMEKLAAHANEVYLATDPDREGEAIAWHIKEVLHLKKPQRVVFHEITPDAIEEALKHPRTIDKNLRSAQEARRVLDRIVGYDLSGLIWKKVRYGLSAGRVQSPALRILAEREREVRAFVPETYYLIDAIFDVHHTQFPARCSEEIKSKDEAQRILREGRKASWTIQRATARTESRAPRAPFTTSTLQQVASTRLGFSPSRTMRSAQKLYEGGHITYMRTDSVNLAKEAIGKIAHTIEETFGKEFVQVRAYKTKSKNAQEAHEAIRPTNPQHKTVYGSGDEKQLYELIRIRALASQMKDASIERTRILTQADKDIPLFVTNGSRLLFPGWLALDAVACAQDVLLPKLTEGEKLTLVSLDDTEKQTEPPKRYSEAGLIKELEKRGIGRPSTYASTIKTLGDRGYVERQQRTLIPTATGMVVSGWLEEQFPSYISDSFTAEMEDNLDEIARGERNYEETLQEFYIPFEKAIKEKEGLPKATSLGDGPEEFPCPKCKGPMEYKLGRGGIFLSCKKYPECTGARQEDGNELTPDKPIGTDPQTGQPVFLRTGRYGPYVEMPLPQMQSDTKDDEKTSKNPKRKISAKSKKTTKKVVKKKVKKIPAKRASVPPGVEPTNVTIEDALRYLSLPKELGEHPETGLPIIVNRGRFGPYVMYDGEFRSLGKDDDPYTIDKERAVALLAQPKKPPRGAKIVLNIGKHPKTGRMITLYQSKQGYFLKKGLRRIYIAEEENPTALTPQTAATLLA